MRKWFEKYEEYIWFSLITVLSSFLGATIVYLIPKKNFGSIADWVSGIGALGAIIVALWQIIIQRKKEEKDRKLANRPFFSYVLKTYLQESKDKLWLLPKYEEHVSSGGFFERESEHIFKFKKRNCAYEFTNVSKAVATSVVLKIEYQNGTRDKVLRTDYCKIRKCVMGNEEVIILPTSMITEPSTYARCPKNVYLYFTTIDDRAYCQRWIGKKSKLGSIRTEIDIKEIPKEEIPIKGVYGYSSLILGAPKNKDT